MCFIDFSAGLLPTAGMTVTIHKERSAAQFCTRKAKMSSLSKAEMLASPGETAALPMLVPTQGRPDPV
jgi:hypothetical protein